MARFVAKYAKYSVGIRDAEVEHFATGREHVIQRGLEAQFEQGEASDYEVEIAVKSFSFTGLPEDREVGGNVHPRSRVGSFDSEVAKKRLEWTEEEHELILKELRSSDSYGVEFIEVEVPRRPAPWGGYDKLTDSEKVVDIAIATETDLAEVLAYERENLDRADVVSALESLLDEEPPRAIEIEA